MLFNITHSRKIRTFLYTVCIISTLATCVVVFGVHTYTPMTSSIITFTINTYNKLPSDTYPISTHEPEIDNTKIVNTTIEQISNRSSNLSPIHTPISTNTKTIISGRHFDTNEMVSAHNAIRNALQVHPLEWSDLLAESANAWASKLIKNECRLQHESGIPYGENIYISWTTNSKQTTLLDSPSEVVKRWSSEVSDYDYIKNTCRENTKCGHYTQIVWRDTRRVGCAVQTCTTTTRITDVWVCRYDPAGNNGLHPY